MGVVNGCIQDVWLQGNISELEIGRNLSIVIFHDNKNDIKISTYPVTKQRTKHVEIRMHYIRELVYHKAIVLQY